MRRFLGPHLRKGLGTANIANPFRQELVDFGISAWPSVLIGARKACELHLQSFRILLPTASHVSREGQNTWSGEDVSQLQTKPSPLQIAHTRMVFRQTDSQSFFLAGPYVTSSLEKLGRKTSSSNLLPLE